MSLLVTGTQVNYFFVCKRKLWLFSKHLSMEQTSELVTLGQLLHEQSYKKNFKEILIDNLKIDFLHDGCEVHEIKKSKKIEKAHIYQLLYYIYYLKKKGINAKGIINYPLLRRIEKVELTEEKEKEIEKILDEIKKIISSLYPPEKEKKPYCKKCSYFELCWS
ncbi:MAG: CRISPR-associated protein Cas4 [Candidatus Pacearchaeota archaeon]